MRELVTAYIGLGANLGSAASTVATAIDAIADMDGVALTLQSSLYSSAPVDAGGPDYVNAVVEIQTRLTAPDLLSALQAIELGAGRERPYRNAPRTLDLDLLLYGDARIASATLDVPHPRMRERAFVLLPLAEIAPHRVAQDQLDAVANQRVQTYGS
ncbi:2-amino-4-hydroxy-6-hydroxymethyldihydropteridine diphosphokinase [Rhodoferax saidenbachensis]|uniref:2-amino-4-hydroxy-6-hydroxymethyldihydropteridine pyrophosphokinase n=1 Tax=Rhodoferax saidenbachensis TaxID=1484693 RepID=A0A1P8KBI7_9BURK|nr:2-amino-4-hydroxy-6-hydroxymethyldihydropteridine diphosphokinase [Rhodoferax saidenbachensis]APW43373.1 2-amino-4-hydroxy-6-hydroxymethyldihydropteridine diphosphokinase [Rhodoferax saidenbachensis]